MPNRQTRLFGAIIILALVLLACGTSTTGTVSSNTPTTSTPGSSETPTPASVVSKVGGTITLNEVAVTLVSVKRLAGDEFTQPKAGNEFIVVHVKIVNKSSSEVDYNPFDFHVRSGSGNITDEEFSLPSSYTANNMLSSGKLSAGGNVEGDIGFQVKKGDHAAQLTWQPSFLGNAGDNAWNLGL